MGRYGRYIRVVLALAIIALGAMIMTPLPRLAAQQSAPAAADVIDTQDADETAVSNDEENQPLWDDLQDRPAVTMTEAEVKGAASGRFPPGLNAGIIRVEGMVYGYSHEALEARVQEAIAHGAEQIVIELDTPGGDAFAALQMAKFLKNLNLPTVAWVNPQAYSAGIIIGSACDGLVMAPSSATGDSAPIAPGQNLAPTERAKILSPILAEFRGSAQINGYDYPLFHAMTVLGVKLYLVEHPQTGQRHVVNEADYLYLVKGAAEPQVSIVPQHVQQQLPQDVQPRDVGEVTRSISYDIPNDLGTWKLIRQVHDGQTLLTLTAQEAEAVGLSAGTVASEEELRQLLGAVSLTRYEQSVGEGVARFLASPIMKGIFLVLLFVGVYLEMLSPGLGAGGVLALVALVGLIAPPLLIGLAAMWHVILIFVGMILLAVEIFAIPGFGAFGISGLVCIFIGVAFLGVPSGSGGGVMPSPEFYGHLRSSAIATIAAIAASVVAMIAISKYSQRVPFLGKFVLASVPRPGEGTGRPLAGSEVLGVGVINVGDEGRSTTDLRPSGVAEIDGVAVDVTTPGEWVEVGRKVRVLEITGNIIIVEPVG